MSTLRLRQLVTRLAALLDEAPPEAEILARGGKMLGELITYDDWLPEAFARADAARYSQHLLHCDSLERFCVVSFIWAPGQETPIHDHTVWGLVGVMRGGEMTQAYDRQDGRLAPRGAPRLLAPGEVEALSPALGDIHRVWNASPRQESVSIHVYGGNIGTIRRSTYSADGSAAPFVSAYSNVQMPNIWSEADH